MIKRFFTLAMLAGACGVANAQVVAELGFEEGEEGKYVTEGALNPGTFGDFVNKKDGDDWEENYSDAKSGDACFHAYNTGDDGASYDRGFKMNLDPFENNTAYRVSFWMKATPDWEDGEGATKQTQLKGQLGVGIENFDCGVTTANWNDYSFDYKNFTDEWQRLSFNCFFLNMDVQNGAIANRDWIGSSDMGDGTTYREYYENKFPEKYFAIFNMYSPSEYFLDDIVIEKATFGDVAYCDKAIRINYGYETNIAALAAASEDGYAHFDKSLVTVKMGDEELEIAALEGLKDGYLYAFLTDEAYEAVENAEYPALTVSLTSPEEIIYSGVRRPSADVETKLQVVSFENETAYYNGAIDALSSLESAPKLVRTIPENNSFELDPATLENVTIVFDKAIDISSTSAVLMMNNMVQADLSSNMQLSDDETELIIPLPANLPDGEYVVHVEDICNIAQVNYESEEGNQIDVILQIGEVNKNQTQEMIYLSDFNNEMTGGVPKGWLTDNEAGIHAYGFDEDGIQWGYGWGHAGTNNLPGNPSGGCKLEQGFTNGEFTKGLYWGTRGTTYGKCTYGELIKDYLDENEEIVNKEGIEVPSGFEDVDDYLNSISLKLTPGKYQVSFLMCAWKSTPKFSFQLTDLKDKIYCKFTDYLAAPTVKDDASNWINGGDVSDAVECTADFTVNKEGYYILNFIPEEATWREYVLGKVKVATMPPKAAYYQQLREEYVNSEDVQALIANSEDEMYNGETKTAFLAAIDQLQNGEFHAPSEVENLLKDTKALAKKLQARIDNIGDFDGALESARQTLEDNVGTAYAEFQAYKDVEELYEQYKDTDPSTLSDEELAEVTPQLKDAANKISGAIDAAEVVTFGVKTAATNAETLGSTSENIANARQATTNDRELAEALKGEAKLALYNAIANEEDLTSKMVKVFHNDPSKYNADADPDDENYNLEGYPLAVQGIDLTGMINNPNFYTVQTGNLTNESMPGWTVDQEINVADDENQTGKGTVHYNGDDPTSDKFATDVHVNNYGNSNFKLFQVLENVPVGKYAITFNTRTGETTDENGETVPFNAQGEDEVWDKYVFAQVGDGDMIVAPYIAGSDWNGYITLLENICVTEEGQTITIGMIENYLSGKAIKDGAAADYWDTNTTIDNARIYFVEKDPVFDYGEGATGIKDAKVIKSANKRIFNISGQELKKLQRGINIVDGKKRIVF